VIAEALKRVPPEQADTARRLYDQMKEDATYWLGILTLGEGDYETAVDYLGRMTLDAAPDGRWADAARVNLARATLALGDTAAAAALLRADASPQRFGSRILADRIGKTGNPTPALPAGP
jgi:Flp pilus assembly protein TadD